MKRKFWNWVKNEGERTLFLSGEISDETWYGDEVTPKLFKEELKSAQGDITVWINSPGGDVFAAAQIYNMLMDYPGHVTVNIDGVAASAASVIAMAASTVAMSPVSMMMIHNPATLAVGDEAELGRAIDMLASVKESIINAYQLKTSLSRAKLSKLMDAETWMDARAAIDLGFADRLITPTKTESTGALDDPTTGEPAAAQASGGGVVFSARAADRQLLNKITGHQALTQPPAVEERPGRRLVDLYADLAQRTK